MTLALWRSTGQSLPVSLSDAFLLDTVEIMDFGEECHRSDVSFQVHQIVEQSKQYVNVLYCNVKIK